MTQIGLARIDADRAADWVRGSLAEGSDLSMLVSQQLQNLPSAIVVGPEPAINRGLDHGRGIATADADAAVQGLLASMARTGMKTLVVEDDLARRGDAGLTSGVTFVADRVLRWVELSHGPAAASHLLRSGSSGYPLNAFVCNRRPSELRLKAGHTLSEPETLSLAESTRAVITSVYDAETFLLLAAADLLSVAP